MDRVVLLQGREALERRSEVGEPAGGGLHQPLAPEGGDQERWVRSLEGAGQGEPPRRGVLSRELYLLAGPQHQDRVQCLVEAVAFGARLDTESSEDRCAEAPAQAEHEPAAGQRIEGRRLRRQREGVVDGEEE